jgi:hypothetical protein
MAQINDKTTVTGQELAALLMLTPRRVQQLADERRIPPRAGRDAYLLLPSIAGYFRYIAAAKKDEDDLRAAQGARNQSSG